MWTGNFFEIDIEFIRHGLTPSNELKKYISYTDEGLSEAGIEAVKKNVKAGVYKQSNLVFSSPMKRTVETASIIYPEISVTNIDEFVEISFGDFEGKDYNELKDNLAYCNWLMDGEKVEAFNGEARSAFKKRVVCGLKKVLLMAKEEEFVAIVCHGGTIMSLVDEFTNLGYYDIMINSAETLDVHICFEIKGNNDVSISHFSITNRHNP